jgi:hypothetical protein
LPSDLKKLVLTLGSGNDTTVLAQIRPRLEQGRAVQTRIRQLQADPDFISPEVVAMLKSERELRSRVAKFLLGQNTNTGKIFQFTTK